MAGFLLALQFLTIIPVRLKDVNAKEIARSMIWFPFIGAILGFFLIAAADLLCSLNFPFLAVDTIIIILLIFITGGIHLDGLSDTFDAILSGKNKEEMLKIMRDPHAGVMGILAIVSIILLKIVFLHAISSPLKPIALGFMCVVSRWSMVFSMFLFPYARQEGKAKVYINGMNLKILILATLVALVFVVGIFKMKGALVFLIMATCAYLIGRLLNKKIGGITGDTLGATNEIIETLTLFFVCLAERSNLWII